MPIIAENCPACFEAPKERHRMKQLLAQQEVQFPRLFNSLQSALKPLISIDKCQISIKTLSEYGLRMVRQDENLYKELINISKNDKEFENEKINENCNIDNDLSEDLN